MIYQKSMLLVRFIYLFLIFNCFNISALNSLDQEPLNFQIKLIEDLGQLHHPVTTKNAKAQAFFDQGLKLIYGFNRPAAFWSFFQSKELDPQLAMAYWGMALALGPNINESMTLQQMQKAYQYVRVAKELSKNSSQIEQDYIQALQTRYTDFINPDFEQLYEAYAKAMKQLFLKYPEDLDAATLYAESLMDLHPWKLWNLDGTPIKGTIDLVDVLESVLQKDSNHIGANHYYIHAVEASMQPERALPCAQRIGQLAPLSGHLIHMASHIFFRLGDYHSAAQANEQAIRADHLFSIASGSQDGIPLHYLITLLRSYSMEGRYQDAKSSAEKLLEYSQMLLMMQEFSTIPYYNLLLRFHRWSEILQLPIPSFNMPMAKAVWHAIRTIAYVSEDKMNQAIIERKNLSENLKRIPPYAKFGNNQASRVLKIYEYLADAYMTFPLNFERGVANLGRAIELEDSLEYAIPPDWFYPIRETLGAHLLRGGLYSKAEEAFRESLEKHPKNGWALFGLLTSLKLQKKDVDEITFVQQEYDQAWQYADISLDLKNLL